LPLKNPVIRFFCSTNINGQDKTSFFLLLLRKSKNPGFSVQYPVPTLIATCNKKLKTACTPISYFVCSEVDDIFTCIYCRVKFKHLRSCQTHMDRHHNSNVMPGAAAASQSGPPPDVDEEEGDVFTPSSHRFASSSAAAAQSNNNSPLLAHVKPLVQPHTSSFQTAAQPMEGTMAGERKPEGLAAWPSRTNVVAPTRSASGIRVVRNGT
jgi:hypothetical protein